MNPSFPSTPPLPPPSSRPSPAAGAACRISSAELFRAARELEIDHEGSLYRLRITSTGKLILTK